MAEDTTPLEMIDKLNGYIKKTEGKKSFLQVNLDRQQLEEIKGVIMRLAVENEEIREDRNEKEKSLAYWRKF